MRTALRSAAALLALAAFAAGAQAPATAELAGRLFERCGLAVQLDGFPQQFDHALAEQRGRLPDETLKALSGAAKESFALPVLREDVVAVLARELSAEDMKRVLAWLESPVGRRMTIAEEKASGTMTQENMQAYLEREKKRPAAARRAKLIADLIEAIKAEETSAAFVEAIALSIAVGMDATQPVEKRVGVFNLRARLRVAMPPERLRATLKATLPAVHGYTYRDVADADLAAYVKFNASPLGKRYNEAVTDALAQALTRASVRVGEAIQRATEKKAL